MRVFCVYAIIMIYTVGLFLLLFVYLLTAAWSAGELLKKKKIQLQKHRQEQKKTCTY